MIKAAEAFKNQNPNGTFRYLVYGRLAMEEARANFGTNAIVSNIHQLAYHHTLKNSNMWLLSKPFATKADIPKSIKFKQSDAFDAIMLAGDFYKSESLKFSEFLKELHYNSKESVIALAKKIIAAMFDGSMGCTHDAYLKLFHSKIVNGLIKLDPVDVLVIDEANDLNKIMLDLFKHYPAKLKILIGDPKQRIMSFMGCVNAFDYYPKAKQLTLSQSFRCNTNIAKRVQQFGRFALDDNFIFEGFGYENSEIKTRAFLSRTNADLIDKIIQLKKQKVPFKLATKQKVKQMFEVPLAVLRCKRFNKETSNRFKDLQEKVDIFYNSKDLQNEFGGSRLKYLLSEIDDDIEIISAIRLIMNYGPETILSVYNEITHERHNNASYTLYTAHTSKGTTVDEVELSDSMNEAIEDTIFKLQKFKNYEPDEEEIAELYLYYVAVTRARHNVINATYIENNFLQTLQETELMS